MALPPISPLTTHPLIPGMMIGMDCTTAFSQVLRQFNGIEPLPASPFCQTRVVRLAPITPYWYQQAVVVQHGADLKWFYLGVNVDPNHLKKRLAAALRSAARDLKVGGLSCDLTGFTDSMPPHAYSGKDGQSDAEAASLFAHMIPHRASTVAGSLAANGRMPFHGHGGVFYSFMCTPFVGIDDITKEVMTFETNKTVWDDITKEDTWKTHMGNGNLCGVSSRRLANHKWPLSFSVVHSCALLMLILLCMYIVDCVL